MKQGFTNVSVCKTSVTHWKKRPRFQQTSNLCGFNTNPAFISRSLPIHADAWLYLETALIMSHWWAWLGLTHWGRDKIAAIFKYIFLNENVWIPLKISMKFVPEFRIKDIPALVQIMAWHRPGDKPLYEPMMVSLVTYICVTRPQWVNASSNFMILPIISVINSLVPERCSHNLNWVIIKSYQRYVFPVKLNGIKPHWWLVTISTGNGLVPSSNKPLPDPMLS